MTDEQRLDLLERLVEFLATPEFGEGRRRTGLNKNSRSVQLDKGTRLLDSEPSPVRCIAANLIEAQILSH